MVSIQKNISYSDYKNNKKSYKLNLLSNFSITYKTYYKQSKPINIFFYSYYYIIYYIPISINNKNSQRLVVNDKKS